MVFRVVVFNADLKALIDDVKQAVLERCTVRVLREDDALRQDPGPLRDVSRAPN